MENLLIYLPFLIPVIVANLSERHRHTPYRVRDPQLNELLDWGLRYLPYGLLIAVNLGLLGLAVLALLNEFATAFAPELMDPTALAANWLGVAAACVLTGLLATLPLIPALRRWLARWLPLDPGSYVHTTALAFAIYHTGLSLGLMSLIGDLENLISPEMVLTIWDVILSGVPWILFGLAGVGLFIRRGGRSTLERLGIRRPTGRHLLVAVVVTALLLAFDFVVNLAWETADPAGYDLLERVSENIFGGLVTVGGALALGLSAGISEELLFRGAVQPRLGLVVTAFLFAVAHLQYGLSLATVEILIIGLVLGLVRQRTSTTICMIIHASYNTVGTLLEML
jgi:membrane protease YdiL (CAAX protease family)